MACLSNLAERVGVTENSESAWADAEKTRKGADQALDKLSSVCSSSQTATPWSALRKNYVYLSNALHFDSFLLSRLYEYSFISRHELDLLHSCKLSYEDKIHHLIVQLPSNSPEKFPEFCQILRRVGQSDVAERLEQHASQDKSKLLRSSSSHHRKKSLKRLLEAKVARLEKEKAAAVREAEEERQIAFAAAEQVLDKTVRAPSFRALDSNVKTRDDDIESLAKNIEEEFARLTKDSLAECSDIWNNTPNASNIAGKQQTSGNSMPRTEWHFPTPCTSWLYGKLGSVEDRLVVLANGIDQLYVQNDNSDEWNIFAREDSVIKHVMVYLFLFEKTHCM
ncbi:uncharacterized protein LOC134198244 isoform X2 [Corticium candelabrum]|uniref:uncharacterized protein LOC134198244 isoform X2 n=1 Tax=Corticium candelabrum TaxID=121492 RepID=UPI002E27482E|nr:uncharacterized protein LOC134198244 isoform X2 [Corticium candelabrum]